MRIVVGVGTTEQSRAAVLAAEAIARSCGGRVTRVRAEPRSLRERWLGVSGSAILKEAENAADLVVVGTPSSKRARFGFSPTVQIAGSVPIPLLAVRSADPFLAAVRGTPLRVLLATDLSVRAAAAVEWTCALARWLPCEVTAAYSVDTLADHARYDIGPATPMFYVDRLLQQKLEEELETQIEPVRQFAPVEICIQPNLGQTAAHLELMAHQLRTDLVIVAANQHSLGRRLAAGSTSRELLTSGEHNVLSVPVTCRMPAAIFTPTRQEHRTSA